MEKKLPKVKFCPICGSTPTLKISDLGRLDGRGYPGCFCLVITCPKCNLPKPVSSNTIYISLEKANKYAIKQWNEQVKRIETFLKEAKKNEKE